MTGFETRSAAVDTKLASAELSCAVIIATRNRRVELERTLQALRDLDPAPDEILVCADGCTDGTEVMLGEQLPEARLMVNAVGCGSVTSRDKLIRQARSEIVLCLDDDSHPMETDFIARLKTAMSRLPEAAVLTFPQRTDEYPETLTASPRSWGPERCVSSYASSGAALRRSYYLEQPGYATFFAHMYEEPDYALQCYAAGRAVVFTPEMTVRHYYTSTSRNETRAHALHARNEQWSVWMRCPLPCLPAVALFRLARQFRHAWRRGLDWAWREPVWWLAALRGLPQCLRHRQPVPWRIYWQWMKLARRPLSRPEWAASMGDRSASMLVPPPKHG